MLNQPTTFAKNVNAALMAIVNFIAANRRITIRCNPNTREIITVYFVVDKLAQTVFVHVDAASLAVMNFTMYDGGISAGLDFETGNSVIVNVIAFKVSLEFFLSFFLF